MNAGERKRMLTGLAFISPWLVGFAVFTAYPLAAALYYSFCDYDVLSRPIWVGLLNYREMGTDDVFWQSLNNTLVFSAISLPGRMSPSRRCDWINFCVMFRAIGSPQNCRSPCARRVRVDL